MNLAIIKSNEQYKGEILRCAQVDGWEVLRSAQVDGGEVLRSAQDGVKTKDASPLLIRLFYLLVILWPRQTQ